MYFAHNSWCHLFTVTCIQFSHFPEKMKQTVNLSRMVKMTILFGTFHDYLTLNTSQNQKTRQCSKMHLGLYIVKINIQKYTYTLKMHDYETCTAANEEMRLCRRATHETCRLVARSSFKHWNISFISAVKKLTHSLWWSQMNQYNIC